MKILNYNTINIIVFCINLITRKDRYENSIKEFNKVSLLSDKVNYLQVEKHNKGGRYGCFDSHIQCIKDFNNTDNVDYVMIFEDDFQFINDYNKNLIELLNFLEDSKKNNKNFNILFSQERVISSINKKINNNFYYGNMYGANLYILNKIMTNNILNNYHNYIDKFHFDEYFINYDNLIIHFNPLVRPLPYGSDNGKWSINHKLNIKKYITDLSQYLTDYTTIIDYIMFNLYKIYFSIFL